MNNRRTMNAVQRAAVVAAILLAPALAFAAGGEHHGPDWPELGSQIINFCIYLGLIVFLAKKPAQAFFAARREAVVTAMNASQVALEAAEARLAETLKKIENLDGERESVLAEFRELGENERRRIVAEAEAEAAKIVKDAELGAERESKVAKSALERRMVDLALAQARAELNTQMNATTQSQLIDNGIAALSAAN